MILDIIAALLITYGFYIGYKRGLVKTVVYTLAFVVALVIAFKFSPILIGYLQNVLKFNPAIEFFLGFLFVFFVVLLLLRFLADRLQDVFESIGINIVNQLLGGALLGLVFAFSIGALLMLVTNLRILPTETMQESWLYGHLIKVGQEGWAVVDWFKTMFSEFWDKFMDTLDQVKEKSEKTQPI